MKYEINSSEEAHTLYTELMAEEREKVTNQVNLVMDSILARCCYKVRHDHSICISAFKGGTVCSLQVSRIFHPTNDELSILQHRPTTALMCDPLYNTVQFYWEGNKLTQRQHDVLGDSTEELEELLTKISDCYLFTSDFTLVFYPHGGDRRLEIGGITQHL